jgi:hypothetical protein
MIAASDLRGKRILGKAAETADGYGLYVYKYNDSDEWQIGVLAQEVAERDPLAVITLPDGRMFVNYLRIRQ